MPTEKRKHRLTSEERRRGQAAGAATKRERREEERELLREARAEHLDEAIERPVTRCLAPNIRLRARGGNRGSGSSSRVAVKIAG
jgi:hypothetical protein